MKVADVMTREVVTVRPESSVQDAAHLMVTHQVSGLPVVDASGTLVGVISEGDLIMRQQPREQVPWWRAFFTDAEELARHYRKVTGTTVGEVMTRQVLSVSPGTAIESAALILDRERIRRLPVVARGKVVGVVSRGDLVRVLADTLPSTTSASDQALAEEMRARMGREPWVSAPTIVVETRDGTVALWGVVENAAEKSALETMARAIPGARGVESHLAVKSEIPYLYAS